LLLEFLEEQEDQEVVEQEEILLVIIQAHQERLIQVVEVEEQLISHQDQGLDQMVVQVDQV
jgi:hypothetical protein